MTPPINIDGTQITGASIDGTDVQAITVDGTEVFSAGPSSEVDQFERGSPLQDRYSGSTGDFAVNTNSPVFEGSSSLKADTGVSNESIVSQPGDNSEDLSNYPTRGDQIQGIVRPEANSSASRVFFYGESGTSFSNFNGYVLTVSVAFDQFTLSRETTTIASESASPRAGQSYLVNIFSNSSDIQVEVIDRSDGSVDANLSATDSTFSGSGFGFGARDTETFDDFRLASNRGLP